MYVKQLRLVNIRSFKDTTIEFSPGINLLVGHNNSGKSTIIKSLYKLQETQTLKLDDVRKTTDTGRLLIDVDDLSPIENSLFRTGNERGEYERAIKIHYEFAPKKEKSEENFYFRPNAAHLLNADGSISFGSFDAIQGIVKIPFQGLPKNENQNNFIYPFFAKRKNGFYGSQNLGEVETFSITEDLRNITSKIQKLSNGSHRQNKAFSRHVEDILGFQIGVIPYGETQATPGIYIGNSTVPIANMGDGVVNILGLLTMLLTEDRKLYLIEELENDIHPLALKKLLDLIIKKADKNQFVVSTHSNIVVKYLGIKNSKIFKIDWRPNDKDEDGLPTSDISIVEDQKGRMELLEALGYDLLDFNLYRAYLIFEESSAEAIIRDFLMPEFCPTLSHSVKTIAANGAGDLNKRIHTLTTLMVYIHQAPIYNKKAWVIADGEAAGKEAIESIKEKFKSWPAEHFKTFSKSNFEEYFPDPFREKFEQIPKGLDEQKKRQEKKQLLHEVQNWIKDNREEAKAAFETSAAEVIQILKGIEEKLT